MEKLALELGLTKEEYKKILDILGHEPCEEELGIFSALWNEHCSYKSSKIHLKKFPTKSDRVLQGPGENAGVVDIGDGWVTVFKMESHNHPSYIEPFQGAATGVGGILRDIFTMGARPICLMDSLRFGELKHPKTKYLVDKVVEGIAFYGNCIGVPTVGGETYFDKSYNGNILVNVFCLGIAKKENIFLAKSEGAGNPIIYVGSKTGKDGIHGASMASDVFSGEVDAKLPTVQVGDPFTEKLLLEACLELMKTDYIVGIQDMGAAGMTCSTFEMADRGNSGMKIDLTKVPLRAENMTPFEILLSESQERMLIVAKKGLEDKVIEIFEKWDLDAVKIGEVIDENNIYIKWKDHEIKMPVSPCTSGAPLYNREIEKPEWADEINKFDNSEISTPSDLNKTLCDLLGNLNIASKKSIYRQYDHMVMTNTVLNPGSDASLLRVKGTKKELGVTVNCNSTYCYLDPYMGALISMAESARNLACVGVKPIAITDCLNFGNPEKPEVMWQFTESIRGIIDGCNAFNTPVISGNVSFYNETDKVSINPTPTIGMVGIREENKHHITSWFKKEGDVIILLGENTDEIGGSEYQKTIFGEAKGTPPKVDIEKELAVQNTVMELVNKGLVESAHDTSEGGLGVALAESCVCQPNDSNLWPVGAKIMLSDKMRWDLLLFAESQARVIVSAHRKNADKIKEIAKSHNAPCTLIGQVGGEKLIINNAIEIDVKKLKYLWEYSFFEKVVK